MSSCSIAVLCIFIVQDGTYQITAGDVTEEIIVSSVVTSNGGNGGMPSGARGERQQPDNQQMKQRLKETPTQQSSELENQG